MRHIHFTTLQQQRGHESPLLAELASIYDALDDEGLIERLKSYRWTGRPGYTVEAMWRSYLAGYVLNLPSTNALVRRLQEDPPLARFCGFSRLPSRWTFNRFVIRLSENLPLVEDVLNSTTRSVAERLLGFGRMLAVDSTTVRTHANPNHGTDVDASWTKKLNSHGKKAWFHGYKLHLASDAETELPVFALVTTAKNNDSPILPGLLDGARRAIGIRPAFVLADAGYDSIVNFDTVLAAKATPIIKRNKHTTKTGRWAIKHQRLAFDEGSREWSDAYAKRASIERVFSRLKEHRTLNRHCRRGLDRVRTHCLSAVLVMQLDALAKVNSERIKDLRMCTRKVA